MARIKYETAEAFWRRKPYRDGSNFYSTGDALYSYGMRLAHWDGNCVVVDYVDRWDGGPYPPSATTNQHMRAVSRTFYPGRGSYACRYFDGASCEIYPRYVRGHCTYRPKPGRVAA